MTPIRLHPSQALLNFGDQVRSLKQLHVLSQTQLVTHTS